MFGAIVGDVVGSIYEFDNIKTKKFELFDKYCMFTDDTVMTIATGKALVASTSKDLNNFKKTLIKTMHEYGENYPDVGYGGHFLEWLKSKSTQPYNSCGNGSAMRVSSIGLWAQTLQDAEEYAAASAEVTHNHPDGIAGAKAVAGAIFLAKTGSSKDDIKKYVEDNYYSLDFSLDEIRESYEFEATCQKSIPQAIVAFLESTDFEDAIRNAISIGGDSDTIAAITGSIAEAFYGIDEDIKETALSYLDENLVDDIYFIIEHLKKS